MKKSKHMKNPEKFHYQPQEIPPFRTEAEAEEWLKKRRGVEEKIRVEEEVKRAQVREKVEGLAGKILEWQREKEERWAKLQEEGKEKRVSREKRSWEEVVDKTIKEKARELGVEPPLVREQIQEAIEEIKRKEEEEKEAARVEELRKEIEEKAAEEKIVEEKIEKES